LNSRIVAGKREGTVRQGVRVQLSMGREDEKKEMEGATRLGELPM